MAGTPLWGTLWPAWTRNSEGAAGHSSAVALGQAGSLHGGSALTGLCAPQDGRRGCALGLLQDLVPGNHGHGSPGPGFLPGEEVRLRPLMGRVSRSLQKSCLHCMFYLKKK